MRYFTPALFTAFNSKAPATAREASVKWDRAVSDYERHLHSIQKKVPSAVRHLSKLHLHDAEFIDLEELNLRSRNPVAQLMVRQQGNVVVLSYFLLERVQATSAIRKTPFSGKFVHWLYDEIDFKDRGHFAHEILWSDGSTLCFQFEHVTVLSATTGGKHRQRRKVTA